MSCTRLSDERLVDLLFGEACPEQRAHAADCPSCGRRLRRLEQTLLRVGSAEVPEPSPLYWPALRRSVGRQIERSRRLWRWAPLAAAAAVLVAAFGIAPGDRIQAPGSPAPALPSWVALPPVGEDVGVEVLEGMLSTGVQDEDLIGCSGLAPCLASLSESETQALVEALRAELKGVDS